MAFLKPTNLWTPALSVLARCYSGNKGATARAGGRRVVFVARSVAGSGRAVGGRDSGGVDTAVGRVAVRNEATTSQLASSSASARARRAGATNWAGSGSGICADPTRVGARGRSGHGSGDAGLGLGGSARIACRRLTDLRRTDLSHPVRLGRARFYSGNKGAIARAGADDASEVAGSGRAVGDRNGLGSGDAGLGLGGGRRSAYLMCSGRRITGAWRTGRSTTCPFSPFLMPTDLTTSDDTIVGIVICDVVSFNINTAFRGNMLILGTICFCTICRALSTCFSSLTWDVCTCNVPRVRRLSFRTTITSFIYRI